MEIRSAGVSLVCCGGLLLLVIACGKVGGDDLGKDAAAGGTGRSTGGSGGIATSGAGGIVIGGAGGIHTGGVGGGALGTAAGGAGGGGTGGRRDASPGDARVDGEGFSGGIGGGGIGGGGTGGGAGGTGGTVNSPCPREAPSNGSKCDYVLADSCVYEDCAGIGRTLAVCESGIWQITTVPCTPVSCDGSPTGSPCALGQVCLYRHRGYVTRDCVTPTCGTGLITPECVPGSIGSCSVTATPTFPTAIYCSYCSGAGGCQ